MRYIKVLIIVFLFFFCMIFFVQNTEILSTTIKLNFHLFGLNFTSSPIPVYVFILVAFVVGAIVSMLYFILEKIRHMQEIKRYKERLKNLEEEVTSLRRTPLQETESPYSYSSETPEDSNI